mgnify:CR=1 FL=1
MKKIAIIGGGISGLFIANLFRQNPDYEIIAVSYTHLTLPTTPYV